MRIVKTLAVLCALSGTVSAAAELDGAALYMGAAACFTCHQPDGKGLPGTVPPLADSTWVKDSPERLIRIVLHGLSGPILVDGRSFNALMPPHAQLNDAEVAAVLTYVRSHFGKGASAITAEQVAAVRAAPGAPEQPWETEALLQKFPFDKKQKAKNGLPPEAPKLDPVAMAPVTEIQIVRAFLPGSTPAAIAVAYPGPQYLVWDAGMCCFRYAWQDKGFLHALKEHWSSNGKPVARIEGAPYFRTRDDAPIRFGKADAPAEKTDYLGYRLVARNPHFLYKLGPASVEEWFESDIAKKALVWHLKISEAPADLFVNIGPQRAVLTADGGELKDGILHLTPAAAAAGTAITIVPIPLPEMPKK